MRRRAVLLSVPSRMSIWIAERELPVRLSLSNPRMSFWRPRIRGRFFRGGGRREVEEGGRLDEAWRRTRRGRAEGGCICVSIFD